MKQVFETVDPIPGQVFADHPELSPAQKIVTLLIAACRRHGWEGESAQECFDWLEERLALTDTGSIGPPSGYGASRPETRPEGNFSGRLREQQAKSAQSAMVPMASRLQAALEENAALKEIIRDLRTLNELAED